MFHYSPAPLNNRFRMLIAFFLAVAFHIGLMNFKFNQKPVLAPSVTLPRSVSVFLNQRSMAELPVPEVETQTTKPMLEKLQAVAIERKNPVLQINTTIEEKRDIVIQKPALHEKAVKQPAVIKTTSAAQRSEITAKDLMPNLDEAARIQESVSQVESLNTATEEGVSLPGLLQTAYPRYQLNSPPTYPALARKRGKEGTVILQVLVDREGRVDDLEIETSSGTGLLDRAAVSAVRKWSFEPGRRGEKKMPMWVRVPVRFKLKK